MMTFLVSQKSFWQNLRWNTTLDYFFYDPRTQWGKKNFWKSSDHVKEKFSAKVSNTEKSKKTESRKFYCGLHCTDGGCSVREKTKWNVGTNTIFHKVSSKKTMKARSSRKFLRAKCSWESSRVDWEKLTHYATWAVRTPCFAKNI